MHRLLPVLGGAAIAILVAVSSVVTQRAGVSLAESATALVHAASRSFDHSLGGWILGFGRERRRARVFVDVPKPSAESAIPLIVTTDLPSARRFRIDIDLNHDGQFSDGGERGYAEGSFGPEQTGSVRLHGLIHGKYRVRARAVLADGSEVASAVEGVEVLPPPSQTPIAFEPNRGQADEAVLFLARAKGHTVYVTRDETVFGGAGGRATRFRLVGANSWAYPTGAKKLPGIANYFIGNDPDKWRTHIETYEELLTREVYPGIDLVYHSERGRLEYDFRIAPGAEPSVIALEFPDVSRLSIDQNGELLLHLPGGDVLRKSAPLMYQEARGQREALKGDWVLRGSRQAGYAIAAYDRGRELVIDPYLFSTYLGGMLNDTATGIATDAAGNGYVATRSFSLNFPTTVGPVNPGPVVVPAAVVTKINPAGTAVIYSTYFGGGGGPPGGPNGTWADAITVDAAGNAYVTGKTDNGLPTVAGSYQTTFQGGAGVGGNYGDAFATKLNPTGTTLIYSTYLGGSQNEGGNAIAVDAAGNAYIGGWTHSLTTSPVPFPTNTGPPTSGLSPTGFIFKLNPAGSARVYCTYLGGTAVPVPPGQSETSIRGIAVDAAGNAFVTGHTNAPNFPTTPGAYRVAPPAAVATTSNSGFVAKVNPGGTALIYCTWLGGDVQDDPSAIAVDGAGNAYIAGTTKSTTFPTTAGAYQTAFQGGPFDVFVTKLNPAGTNLVYSTYLGGTGDDQAWGLVIDAAGNAYVAGYTGNATFPITAATATQSAFGGGGSDAFVTQLNPTGTALLFSTFLGGSANDASGGIALDATGAMVVVGTTSSNDFPTRGPIQAANAGAQDIFITKLTPGIPGPSPPPGPGILYGITLNSNQLITIDPATAAGTLVGPLSTGMNAFGIAFRGNQLYAWDSVATRLRELDPATGATLATINPGLVGPGGEGDICFRSDGVGFINSLPGGMWRFDPTVPNSSVVGAIGPQMDGLAFDAAGVLYGFANQGGQLFTIDPATAVTTLVGNTGIVGVGPSSGGLAFDSSGNLYAAISPFPPGPSGLYKIDKLTGVATLIGNIGFNGISGIRFLPAPTPPPVPPGVPGNPGNEGTYVGSKGPTGSEGCFGFGGAIMPQRLPLLRGPTPIGERDLLVINVAHLQTSEDCGNGWMVLLSAALAGLIAGALGIRVLRATA